MDWIEDAESGINPGREKEEDPQSRFQVISSAIDQKGEEEIGGDRAENGIIDGESGLCFQGDIVEEPGRENPIAVWGGGSIRVIGDQLTGHRPVEPGIVTVIHFRGNEFEKKQSGQNRSDQYQFNPRALHKTRPCSKRFRAGNPKS